MCNGINKDGTQCKNETSPLGVEYPNFCQLHQNQGLEEEMKRFEKQQRREDERIRRYHNGT